MSGLHIEYSNNGLIVTIGNQIGVWRCYDVTISSMSCSTKMVASTARNSNSWKFTADGSISKRAVEGNCSSPR